MLQYLISTAAAVTYSQMLFSCKVVVISTVSVDNTTRVPVLKALVIVAAIKEQHCVRN